MSDLNWDRIKAAFEAALGASVDERAGVLDRLCAGDAALRREVESLLQARTRDVVGTGGAERMMAPTASAVLSPLTERVGETIGPYRLLQLIGEGGFGAVFLAEQSEPVRRRVALKIIKLGMDTKQVVARFEAERQALALMDHPNIAKVYDAGATATGRPFFVMEYVVGDAITAFAAAKKLGVRERLDLFMQVCRAVQHAHTKGIIHRDLKPANVLVSTVDGRPHAKVIDFGIAKATGALAGLGGVLTPKTLFTEHGQLIGTPEYMSPEQAEGSPDIDTRTDVYALGVMLYELLTGLTPFDAKRLRSAGWVGMQKIIRDEEPAAPSVRLRRVLGADPSEPPAAAGGATPRQTDVARGAQAKGVTIAPGDVKGELDWIVMKALEKERARRYETPGAIADDVARHWAGEAVAAAPAGRVYRVRKFVRRNKGAVIAGLAVAVSLVLGITGTTWQARSAVQERVRAETMNKNYIEERKHLVQSFVRVLEGTGRSDVKLDERGLVTFTIPNGGGSGYYWITRPTLAYESLPMSEWQGDYLSNPLSFDVPAMIEEMLGDQLAGIEHSRDVAQAAARIRDVYDTGSVGGGEVPWAREDAEEAVEELLLLQRGLNPTDRELLGLAARTATICRVAGDWFEPNRAYAEPLRGLLIWNDIVSKYFASGGESSVYTWYHEMGLIASLARSGQFEQAEVRLRHASDTFLDVVRTTGWQAVLYPRLRGEIESGHVRDVDWLLNLHGMDRESVPDEVGQIQVAVNRLQALSGEKLRVWAARERSRVNWPSEGGPSPSTISNFARWLLKFDCPARALAEIERAIQARVERQDDPSTSWCDNCPAPTDHALLAMIHFTLGFAPIAPAEDPSLARRDRQEHLDKAREALAAARAIMADPVNADTWAKDVDAKALLAEAEALIK